MITLYVNRHVYNGILLSHKKEWNNAICSNVDGPRDYHTKWSLLDNEKKTWYYLYLEHKNDTNKIIWRTEVDTETLKTNLWLPKGTEEGEGCTWSLGLTYADGGIWNDWLMGTWCIAQELYPIFCDSPYGKIIWKGVDVCICITESLCCIAEVITTL